MWDIDHLDNLRYVYEISTIINFTWSMFLRITKEGKLLIIFCSFSHLALMILNYDDLRICVCFMHLSSHICLYKTYTKI